MENYQVQFDLGASVDVFTDEGKQKWQTGKIINLEDPLFEIEYITVEFLDQTIRKISHEYICSGSEMKSVIKPLRLVHSRVQLRRAP